VGTAQGHAFSSIPLGFIIYAGEGAHIYHTGDTAISNSSVSFISRLWG